MWKLGHIDRQRVAVDIGAEEGLTGLDGTMSDTSAPARRSAAKWIAAPGDFTSTGFVMLMNTWTSHCRRLYSHDHHTAMVTMAHKPVMVFHIVSVLYR